MTGVDVIAALEARRSLRTGRGFTLVRLAPGFIVEIEVIAGVNDAGH